MGQRLPTHPREYELLWWHESPTGVAVPLRDEISAGGFARLVARQPGAVAVVRRFLSAEAGFHRGGDEEILHRLAALLASGRVHVAMHTPARLDALEDREEREEPVSRATVEKFVILVDDFSEDPPVLAVADDDEGPPVLEVMDDSEGPPVLEVMDDSEDTVAA